MTGRRLRRSTRLSVAASALPFAIFPAVSSAQVAPPGQYVPPGQAPPGVYTPPGPYAPGVYTPPGQAPPGRYTPPPGAQPIPYTAPGATPGYVPLGGHSQDITSDEAHSWPILRVSGGVGLTLLPRLPIKPSFVIDATAGYRLALAPRASIAFEAAYSTDTERLYGGMYGAIGAGPELYVGRYLSLGYSPKLVVGATWQGFAIGVRNTLVAAMFMHVVSVEIGHQYLRSANLDLNEIRAQAAFDVAGLVQLVVQRALAR